MTKEKLPKELPPVVKKFLSADDQRRPDLDLLKEKYPVSDAHNWDTRELDDKKLREQITQIISEFKFGDWLEEVMEHERAAAYEVTNQILALIKQAGYNPPEDNA